MFVFAALGIFSAKYRSYAGEAFSCVFNRITLRPCESGFDQKMKMKAVTKAFKFSPRFGKIVYKRFELISWMFTILLIVSLGYSMYSVYSLAVYGTCDMANPDSCVLTDTASCGCGTSDLDCSLVNLSCECESGETCTC